MHVRNKNYCPLIKLDKKMSENNEIPHILKLNFGELVMHGFNEDELVKFELMEYFKFLSSLELYMVNGGTLF